MIILTDRFKFSKYSNISGVYLPGPRVINIHCSRCKQKLYKYRKDKPGRLVKAYVREILKDHTRGDLKCHKCGQDFARKAMIHGKPAHKIIQGKVSVK